MDPSQPRRTAGTSRAVVPVVAVAILCTLVVLGAAAVFAIGSSAVFAVQDDADTEQATQSMSSMASDLHGGGTADVRLPQEGTAYVDSNASWLRVEVGGQTVVDEEEGQLGTLYYENDGTTIAYEGGGVWRQDAHQQGSVLTAPPIQYARGDDSTLVLPVISIAEVEGPVDRNRLTTVETERTFPNGEISNPIDGNVSITIHSQFYRAWGEHLAQRFRLDPSAVEYDHAAREATVDLTGGQINRTVEREDSDPDPPELEGIPGFVVNDGGELDARQNLHVDSYDSSVDPYPQSKSEGGDIKTTGELDLSNDVTVEGDVDAGGSAEISNNVEVTGDVVVGEGDPDDVTTIDTSGGGQPTTIHGNFSTKEDAEFTGGVQFGGDVIVGGDVSYFEADVDGDMYVLGDMNDVSRNYPGEIQGNLVVVGTTGWDFEDVELEVHGEFVDDPGSEDIRQPIEPLVEIAEPDVDVDAKGQAFDDDNDNDRSGVPIEDRELQNCDDVGFGSDGCRLTAGQYYLEEIDLNENDSGAGPALPETLVLDTSDGPVEIYVEDDVRLEDRGSIQVEYDEDDPQPALLYLDGDVDVDQGADVEVDDDRSPLLELYMQPDATWRIEGGSTFTGSVYGLSDGTQRTTIHLSGGSGSSVYGGLLGDIGQFDQDGQVHYDEALRENDVDRPGENGGDGDLIVTETYETEGADVVYLHIDRRTVASE